MRARIVSSQQPADAIPRIEVVDHLFDLLQRQQTGVHRGISSLDHARALLEEALEKLLCAPGRQEAM
jgi:hypothetical protein